MPEGNHTFDVAVIGAGVFGSWTAWHLTRRGARVALVDMYGPASSRASSGGETRIIRMGYGADEIYTRMSQRSLTLWKELFAATGQPHFLPTGVLWMAGADASRLRETAATLRRCGVEFEELDAKELRRRYPQVNFDGVTLGIFEPGSGVLMARKSVQAVVVDAVKRGAAFHFAQAVVPSGAGALDGVALPNGNSLRAKEFVFACGPWLGKVFPEVLGPRIFPSRQEIFFFGTPAGDRRFAPPALPTWLFQGDEMYGMPDLENRGLKIAFDGHGERVDPDTQSRVASAAMAEKMSAYVAGRFPALRDAPIVETRVCQYENSSNGDFLIDRHPERPNVWLVGGGSGHGFKHGPAVGEQVAARILDGAAGEPRFSLASKGTVQQRAVY